MTDLDEIFNFPKSDWRSNSAIVLEAELDASPPWRVADFLRKRGESLTSRYSDDADEKLELALLARGDPLIDFELARWGLYDAPLRMLWARPRPEAGKSALHLALLSNEVAADNAWSFPANLFGERAEYAQIATLGADEIHALFSNPKLQADFIADFLAGEKAWEDMTEDRRAEAVAALGKRLWTHGRHEDRYDGFANYRHDSVYNSAWKLAATVSVTDNWASVLGPIYRRLKTQAFSFDNPLATAARWVEAPDEEAKHFNTGWLSGYQSVRMGLARLAVSHNGDVAAQLVASDDLALRAGCYAVMEMTPEEVAEFAARDGKIGLNAMIQNEELWRKEKTREALRQACWDVPDRNQTMDLPREFNFEAERLAKEHPRWFGHDESRASNNFAGAETTYDKLRSLEAAIQQQRMIIWAILAGIAILMFRG